MEAHAALLGEFSNIIGSMQELSAGKLAVDLQPREEAVLNTFSVALLGVCCHNAAASGLEGWWPCLAP